MDTVQDHDNFQNCSCKNYLISEKPTYRMVCPLYLDTLIYYVDFPFLILLLFGVMVQKTLITNGGRRLVQIKTDNGHVRRKYGVAILDKSSSEWVTVLNHLGVLKVTPRDDENENDAKCGNDSTSDDSESDDDACSETEDEDEFVDGKMQHDVYSDQCTILFIWSDILDMLPCSMGSSLQLSNNRGYITQENHYCKLRDKLGDCSWISERGICNRRTWKGEKKLESLNEDIEDRAGVLPTHIVIFPPAYLNEENMMAWLKDPVSPFPKVVANWFRDGFEKVRPKLVVPFVLMMASGLDCSKSLVWYILIWAWSGRHSNYENWDLGMGGVRFTWWLLEFNFGTDKSKKRMERTIPWSVLAFATGPCLVFALIFFEAHAALCFTVCDRIQNQL